MTAVGLPAATMVLYTSVYNAVCAKWCWTGVLCKGCNNIQKRYQRVVLKSGVTFCSSGILLAFPQWREGILPENGFAGRLTWEVVETVSLRLQVARSAKRGRWQ